MRDGGGACPLGGVSALAGRDGRSLGFVRGSGRLGAQTWSDARRACEALGYSLAVIDDAPEDAFVFAELERHGFADTWIGLNDRAREMDWVWLDGVSVGYTHWDRGEPNDGGSGEDCGVIMTSAGRASEWDDRACASARPSVCEAPAP